MELLKKEIEKIYKQLNWSTSNLDERLNTLNLYKEYLETDGIIKGIIGPGEGDKIVSRHFYDSISAFAIKDIQMKLKEAKVFADFGTGGGLPGLLLAICFPLEKILLIDSSNRRLNFLKEFLDKIKNKDSKKYYNPPGIELILGRAEDRKIVSKYKNKIDIAFSRAFLPIVISVELVYSYLHSDSLYLNYCGPSFDDDLIHVNEKLEYTALNFENKYKIASLYENNNRCIAVFKKTGNKKVNWPREYKIIKLEWKKINESNNSFK